MVNRFLKIMLLALIFVCLVNYGVLGLEIEGYTTVAGTFENMKDGFYTTSTIRSLMLKDEYLTDGKISAEFSSTVKDTQYPVGIVFAGKGIREYRNVSGSNICYLTAHFIGDSIVLGKSENGVDSTLSTVKLDSSVFINQKLKLSVSFSSDGTVKIFVNNVEVINETITKNQLYGGELGIRAGGDGNRIEITNITAISLSHAEHTAGEIIPEVRANCMSEGKKEHSVCTGCYELIYKKDGVWTAAAEAELTIPKDKNNHIDNEKNLQWLCDENEHRKSCRCGKVFVSGRHDTDLDSFEGICTVCGYNKVHICDNLERIYEGLGNCVTKGVKEHYKCNDCGKLYIRSGNSYVEKRKSELETEILPNNHIDSAETLTWTCDDSKHYKICRCGKVFSSGKHDISAGATQGTCSICNYTRGHKCTYTEIPEVTADCMTKGVIAHYKCKTCKNLYIKKDGVYTKIRLSDLETPKSDSNHVDSVNNINWIFDPVSHKKVCRCGTVLLQKEHEISNDELGKRCTVCGYDKTHVCDYTPVKATQGSCLENRIESHYKCFVCGKLYLKNENGYTEVDIGDITVVGEHRLKKHDAVFGNCTAEAVDEYWECEICKKLFSDENAGNEITNIPKGEKDSQNHIDSDKNGECDLCLYRRTNKESKLVYYILIVLMPIILILCALFVIINRKIFVK